MDGRVASSPSPAVVLSLWHSFLLGLKVLSLLSDGRAQAQNCVPADLALDGVLRVDLRANDMVSCETSLSV